MPAPDVRFGIRLTASRDLFTDGRAPLNKNAADDRAASALVRRATAAAGESAEFCALQAAIHFAFGRYSRALAPADRAVRLAPDWAWGYLWRFRARSYDLVRRRGVRLCRRTPLLSGDYRAALRDIDRAEALEPSNPEIPAWRAELQSSFDEYAACLASLEKTLRLDPSHEFARAVRAEVLTDIGSAREARRDADALVRLHPREEWAYAFRARDLGKSGFVREAFRDLSRALRINPRLSELHAWRAEACRRDGDFRGAERSARQAARLDPGNFHAWLWLGRVVAAAGRPGEALSWYRRAAESDPRLDETFFLLRGEALFKTGRFERAFRDFDRAFPSLPNAMWSVKLRSGRRAPGSDSGSSFRSDIEAAVSRRPRSAWPLLLRARVAADSDPASALTDVEAALRFSPRHAWGLAWRGLLRARQGEGRSALRDLDRAIMIRPRDTMMRSWRGLARLQSGDAAGAASDFSRALTSGVGYGWIYAARGEAFSRLGRPAEGLDDLDEALLRGPKMPEWHFIRARMRRASGLLRPARDDLKRYRELVRRRPGGL